MSTTGFRIARNIRINHLATPLDLIKICFSSRVAFTYFLFLTLEEIFGTVLISERMVILKKWNVINPDSFFQKNNQ